MKPANFPGRKNERRKRALALTDRKKNKQAAHIEFCDLKEVIVSDSVAQSIRTKKDRTDRAKFTARR